MIWSLLKNALNFILPGNDDQDEEEAPNPEEEEKEILNEINKFRNLNTDHLKLDSYENVLGYAGQRGPSLETDSYTFKTGTVTFFCEAYGLIDNKFYFDVDCISPNIVINKNDKVTYITDSSSNGLTKIFKICGLSNESWDPLSAHVCAGDRVMEFKAVRRVVNGKITKLEKRKFFVEPYNVWCNMNKVDVSFDPIEGDWVCLEASVSVDTDALDWAGDIVEVISVKPSIVQNGPGRITFWMDGKNEGVINNIIVFDKTVCNDLHMPFLGDLVSFEAIESDQGKFKWRGIWVKPDKLRQRAGKEKKLFKDKKGIEITQSLSVVDLKIGETKDIIVEVFNKGKNAKTLLRTKFYNEDSEAECQLSLKSPELTENLTLEPSEKLKFVVACTGKNVGSTGELLEFHFDKFRIAKSFEINVPSDDCIQELSRLNLGSCTMERQIIKRVEKPTRGNCMLHGKKPFSTERFFKAPPKKNYDAPKPLWRLLLGPGDIPKSTTDALATLRTALPYLASGLSHSSYVKRFRTLLHLEEIALKIRFSSYAIPEAVFHERDDLWFLEVPGLAEGRPSILPGDKVMVSKPWSTKTVHVGYVHKVECNGIHVDFHSLFPGFTRGNLQLQDEKCDVRFVPNTGTLYKCHQALGKAFNTLGRNWLFPSVVVEKADRVDFEVADEPVNEGEPNGTGEENEKKKLIWKNKDLNERQKMAVVNVLRGVARPLPYIVFGPPGTGKTTTIVEMILQVSSLLPYSRVLVCGPSNSCLDLLAERLIDSGIYKLGELVRLYAISRLQNIPEKLAPYSDCVGSKNEHYELNKAGKKIKGSRVTLGTFGAIGDLHGLSSFENHTFTHIFIDEGGQMTEPETLIPACFLGKEHSQLVLAGDPKQLGPVCTSVVAARLDFDRSMLERLMSMYPYKADRKEFPETSGFDPRLVTKLTVNYRSLPEIVNLPNELFYDFDLVPLISDKDSFEADLLKRINIKVPKRDKNPAIIFHGVVGKNLQESDSPSWFNPQEICQLVVYLKKIYESGVTADEVGIVTPYSKQVQKCRSMLASVNLALPEIGTVNNFQGQEKHVIILSTVRSSVEVLKKDVMFCLGFVASPRRLNVALTRARTLLIILGNPNVLRIDPYWERVIEYCIRNKSYVGCSIKREIKSFVRDKDKDKEKEKEDSDSDSNSDSENTNDDTAPI